MSLFDEFCSHGDAESEELVQGILFGEVKENWDSEHPGMVKVKLLLGTEEKDELDWMPVIVPYAGDGHGIYLLPEIGAQVAVAFYMGQVQSPYVIGSVYGGEHTLPPGAADEKNTVKTLYTQNGNSISILDGADNGAVTIRTKSGHTIELNDEENQISIQDQEGKNTVVIDIEGGILKFQAEKKAVFRIGDKEMLTLDGENGKVTVSADQISLKAEQKLSLKGQNTTVEGSSTTVKGQNVKAEAQASLELKGMTSLKAESSGIFQAKGSLMKLN